MLSTAAVAAAAANTDRLAKKREEKVMAQRKGPFPPSVLSYCVFLPFGYYEASTT